MHGAASIVAVEVRGGDDLGARRKRQTQQRCAGVHAEPQRSARPRLRFLNVVERLAQRALCRFRKRSLSPSPGS